MVAKVQTFRAKSLPKGFGHEGSVKLIRSFDWDRTVKDDVNVAPGASILPQTSNNFCLIDDPRVKQSGLRREPGVLFPDAAGRPQFFIDHHDGTFTYCNRGARLYWSGVRIPPGGMLQFHYVFLRGEWKAPFNAFAQFLAVRPDGVVEQVRTIAETRELGPPESGKFFRWRAFGPIEFETGFDGTLQWVVSNGERRNKGDFTVHPDTDRYPSALALDFISIIS